MIAFFKKLFGFADVNKDGKVDAADAKVAVEAAKEEVKIVQFLPAKKYLAAAAIFVFMGLSMLLYKMNHLAETNTNDSVEAYVQELDENRIENLIANQLATLDANKIVLTLKGRLLADEVFRQLSA